METVNSYPKGEVEEITYITVLRLSKHIGRDGQSTLAFMLSNKEYGHIIIPSCYRIHMEPNLKQPVQGNRARSETVKPDKSKFYFKLEVMMHFNQGGRFLSRCVKMRDGDEYKGGRKQRSDCPEESSTFLFAQDRLPCISFCGS